MSLCISLALSVSLSFGGGQNDAFVEALAKTYERPVLTVAFLTEYPALNYSATGDSQEKQYDALSHWIGARVPLKIHLQPEVVLAEPTEACQLAQRERVQAFNDFYGVTRSQAQKVPPVFNASEFGSATGPTSFPLLELRQGERPITSHWYFTPMVVFQSAGVLPRNKWLEGVAKIVGANLVKSPKSDFLDFSPKPYRDRWLGYARRLSTNAPDKLSKSQAEYYSQAFLKIDDQSLRELMSKTDSTLRIPIEERGPLRDSAEAYLSQYVSSKLNDTSGGASLARLLLDRHSSNELILLHEPARSPKLLVRLADRAGDSNKHYAGF